MKESFYLYERMFQSNTLIVCEVPRKIDECCTVTDALVLVFGNAVNRLKENLKVEDGTVSLKPLNLINNLLVREQLILMVRLKVTKIYSLLYLIKLLMECKNTSVIGLKISKPNN